MLVRGSDTRRAAPVLHAMSSSFCETWGMSRGWMVFFWKKDDRKALEINDLVITSNGINKGF